MQRGGAGGMTITRTSIVTAGPASARPMVRRFTLAVADGSSLITRTKRRTTVFEYVIGWAGCVVVEEHLDEGRTWLIVEIDRPVPLGIVQSFAKACPHYVPGTFHAATQAARACP